MGVVVVGGLGGLVLLAFLENVFLPLPSEIILPLAGCLAGLGEVSLAGVILAGTFGTVAGALPLYYGGRALGDKRMEFVRRHGRWLALSPADVDRVRRWFEQHGPAAVFFCRLLPGVRSLVSLPAGMARMPLLSFLTMTAAGSVVWTAVLASFGYLLGSRYGLVAEYLDPVMWTVLAGAGAGYALRVASLRPA